MGATVQVLHVIDHHREVDQRHDLSGAIGFDASAELTEELARLEETQGRVARLKGKAILDDARKQLKAAGIADVDTLQRHGELVETLGEFEPGVDLVVIGKRGERAHLAKEFLGSNLGRVIRTSVRPILIATRDFKPIESCVIAFDGSASARKAVEYVAREPLLRGVQCHIVMAGHTDSGHAAALAQAEQELRTAGYAVASHHVKGPTDVVLRRFLEGSRSPLLVMGAYGHSPIREFILGSTTTTMVRTSKVPLFMVR